MKRGCKWWSEVIIYRKIHDHSTQVPAQERGPVLLILNAREMCLCLPCPKTGKGTLLWASGTQTTLCTGSGSTMDVGWGCSKIQQGEGKWRMDEARLRCSCSITQAQTQGGSWRAALEKRGQVPVGLLPAPPTRSFPSSLPGCSHSTSELAWALAAKPQRGKMVLEAVGAPRPVCTCVTTQGIGLKRRPVCKNYELRHPNGAEISKWSQNIQMALCHLGLWMYLQIGSLFVNEYMQCWWCIYINSNWLHVTVNQCMLIEHGYEFQLVLFYCESISIMLIRPIQVLLFCSWWGEPSFEHGWEEEAALQALSRMSQGPMC